MASAATSPLLAELGVETNVKKTQTYTPKQERVIAGFEDIQRFARENGRAPQHGETHDLFERLYAVRLDRILADAERLELLRPMDEDGLLTDRIAEPGEDYDVSSDDELLEALGVGPVDDDITTMKHVRTASQRNAERVSPDEVAQRKPCEDFDVFRPVFEAVQADIESGQQTTQLYRTSVRTKISKGDWFIVGHRGSRRSDQDRDDRTVSISSRDGDAAIAAMMLPMRYNPHLERFG